MFSKYDSILLAMFLNETYLDITRHLNGLKLDSDEVIELAQKIVNAKENIRNNWELGLFCGSTTRRNVSKNLV